MKSWYTIKNQAGEGGKPVEVAIHDEIGYWGVTAQQFIRDWNALPAEAAITLSINSPGGEVFDALAIYHAIARTRSRVTGRVEGLAASAASVVLMAAGRIVMPAQAYLMIHNPWTIAWGDQRDLREAADLIDKLRGSLLAIYSERSGRAADELGPLLDAETWLTGAEAVEAKLADAVEELPVVLNCASRVRCMRLPAALTDVAMPAADVVAECREAGVVELAESLIRAGASPLIVRSRLTEAREIRTIAAAAGRPGDADVLIQSGISLEVARERILAAAVAAAEPIAGGGEQREQFTVPAASGAANKIERDFRNVYHARRPKPEQHDKH